MSSRTTQDSDEDLPVDVEYVLVRASNNGGSRPFHLPSEDDPDRPKCGVTTKKKRPYRRRDPTRTGHGRMCRQCDPRIDHTERPDTGPRLTSKLRDLDPVDVRADGGTPCGKRSCDRPGGLTVDGEYGGSKVRCGRHALEELDGIGPAKADRLYEEFGTVEKLCRYLDTDLERVANLPGFSTESAWDLKDTLETSSIYDQVRPTGGVA